MRNTLIKVLRISFPKIITQLLITQLLLLKIILNQKYEIF